MTFFTPERLTKALAARDQGILSLFQDERWRPWREDIDKRLQMLPDEARAGLCRNLERSITRWGNFVGHYHELVMGSLLAEMGFQAEYEPRISGKTPDWRVTGPLGKSFIIDVLECRIPDAFAQELLFCDSIRRQLKPSRAPYWLRMRWQTRPAHPVKVLPRPEIAAEHIRNWLDLSPSLDDELDVLGCGLHIGVYGTDPERTNIVWFGPTKTLFVDSTPLRSKIARKVHRYSAPTHHGCPFLVGVVLNFGTGLEAEDLETALTGPEGVFNESPVLNGCFHLENPENSFRWTARFIENQRASLHIADLLAGYSLPVEKIGGMHSDDTTR